MADLDPLIDGLIPQLQTSKMSTTSAAIPATSTALTTATPNPATPLSTTPLVSSTPLLSSKTSTTTTSSSSLISSAPSSSIPSSSSVPTSSSLPTSSTPLTTSKPTSTSTSTTSTSTTPPLTTTSTASRPGLVSGSATSTSSSATAAAGNTSSGTGIGGSGLSVGALVGIIAGCVVVIIGIAILATRSIRKRQRTKRTRRRSAMMEPWATGGIDDDPAWEKPRYEAPSQSFQMHDTNQVPQYPSEGYSNEPTYPTIEETAYQPSYAEAHHPQASYPATGGQYMGYAPQQQYSQVDGQYQEYPVAPAHVYQENLVAPVEDGMAGVGAGTAAAAAAGGAGAGGLRDGSMVRVKVGFVRSLEDELAVTPGQQLYLHSMYDDGWSLCEDQTGNRGVVPLSCLEPWQNSLAPMSRSATDQSLSGRSERRSSLYQNAQTAGQYLSMPQP